MPDDHPNHLTALPSLKPTSRYDVIQLKHTMEALLSRVGADLVQQKGPTQVRGAWRNYIIDWWIRFGFTNPRRFEIVRTTLSAFLVQFECVLQYSISKR